LSGSGQRIVAIDRQFVGKPQSFGISAALHAGQNDGCFEIDPTPLPLPSSDEHVHCVEGQLHCALYFVSPQLHDALDWQPPFESITVAVWIGVQEGVTPTSTVDPSFLMTLPSLPPLLASDPPLFPPSPVSMIPPQAVSAAQKSKYRMAVTVSSSACRRGSKRCGSFG